MSSASNLLRSVSFFTNHGFDPCAYVRVRGPMRASGVKVVDEVEAIKNNSSKTIHGDLVVIQRDFPSDLELYETIVETSHRQKKPVIFELDDLLFLLPENHPQNHSLLHTRSLLPMLQALSEADLVTVTTEYLKTWLEKTSSRISVLPNFFDDSLWRFQDPDKRASADHPIRIGYMGTDSHSPDMELITPVLQKLLKHFGDKIQLCFWGASPPHSINSFPQVKWFPPQTFNYVEFSDYFQKQTADIFIAPLQDNPFNQAKSPLKFFEYSALGVPGVYSRLEAFEQVVTHGTEGFLASTPDEWYESLVLLVKDPDLRLRLAKNAQVTIRANWLLSKNAYRWKETYEQALELPDQKSASELAATDLIRSVNHSYQRLEDHQTNATGSATPDVDEKDRIIQSMSFELAEIKSSKAWKIASLLRKGRQLAIPTDSKREKIARTVFHWMQGQKIRVDRHRRKPTVASLLEPQKIKTDCSAVDHAHDPIDIIVCVHNAYEDVRRCLESVQKHSTDPFGLIIVDDGSDAATRDYLSGFAVAHSSTILIRNDVALGYTRAANLGMQASTTPFLVLLNSDTIVGPEWLERLHQAMRREEAIAAVGPLSNTASWQSVPKLNENGDWAVNRLPEGVSAEKMSHLIAKYSACIYPEVPLLNGFCLMLRKKAVEELDFFDETAFGQGYGEEDDFNLRAGKAGWKKVIADDVFVYHAQSKSYSHQQRYLLSKSSGIKLQQIHGSSLVEESVKFMNPNRVLEGIRGRAGVLLERETCIDTGRTEFEGKRVLFVLPVVDAGGGANVIIDESKFMRKMGVDVWILNLLDYKAAFTQNYPGLDIPVIYKNTEDITRVGAEFDAVVASANYSVPWLEELKELETGPILGYYVQDYEAMMYPQGSVEARKAEASYSMIKEMRGFTKTLWTRNTILTHTGISLNVVGISVNTDLFRPRDMIQYGTKPVRIVAMIRPGSPYRSPRMTLSVLKRIEKKYGEDIEIWLFGCNDARKQFEAEDLDFRWRQLGKLTQKEVALVLSKSDIFTDFSTHQAMGLTALEAMASGCAVVVPSNGGAVEFVQHKQNGVIVDTSDFDACLDGLDELVKDIRLRNNIQITGMHDVLQYYPEKVSLNILRELFRG